MQRYILTCLVGVLLSFSVAAEKPTVADWVVETQDGKQVSLSKELAKGNRVVAIFWATWCRFCRDLMPELDALQQAKTHNNVTFIALNIWEDNDPMAYIKKHKMSLPVALRADHIAKKYQVKGTPGVFVIGDNNTVLYRRNPGQSTEDVMKAIASALSVQS